jgi:hypothetical protein
MKGLRGINLILILGVCYFFYKVLVFIIAVYYDLFINYVFFRLSLMLYNIGSHMG